MRAGLDEYTTKPLVRAEIVTLLNHFLSDHIVDAEEVVPANVDAIKEKIEEDVPAIEVTEEPQEETVEEITEEVVEEQATEEESSEEVAQTVQYTADILLAKKSPFETKLFTKLLDALGYSYETAASSDELNEKIQSNAYRAILFDKESKKVEK